MIIFDHLISMANISPFIAFCELWVVGCIAGVIFKIINRGYRTVNIWKRGWPPPHLDADGDWKPKEDDKEDAA